MAFVNSTWSYMTHPKRIIYDLIAKYGSDKLYLRFCFHTCMGYWMDFDIDVPKWFKEDVIYYDCLKGLFTGNFGLSNFVIIDTSGGYHILVRTSAIKSNPHNICKEVEAIYKLGITRDGKSEYLDEKGNCKFECIVNDSQIPGLPLPGTYQYGKKVRVINKEDFE